MLIDDYIYRDEQAKVPTLARGLTLSTTSIQRLTDDGKIVEEEFNVAKMMRDAFKPVQEAMNRNTFFGFGDETKVIESSACPPDRIYFIDQKAIRREVREGSTFDEALKRHAGMIKNLGK